MNQDRRWAAGIATAAAGAGHDLGNVLTAIYGHAELARGFVAPDHPAAEELEELLARAEQAHELARRLSLLGRAGLPAMQVDDLGTLLRDLLAARAERTGAQQPPFEDASGRPVAVLAPPTLREAVELVLDLEPADAPADVARLHLDTAPDHARLVMESTGPPPPEGDHHTWHGGALGLALMVLHVGAVTAGGGFRARPGPDDGRVVEVALPLA